MKQIILANGRGIALVDDDDFERFGHLRWNLKPKRANAYARAALPKDWSGPETGTVMMHQIVLGKPPAGLFIDHVNRNGLDNTKANLRFVTGSQNNMNCRKLKLSASAFKGVSWVKRDQRWMAMIGLNKKRFNLGYFMTEIEAAAAYDAAALKHFGEFALLNLPHGEGARA